MLQVVSRAFTPIATRVVVGRLAVSALPAITAALRATNLNGVRFSSRTTRSIPTPQIQHVETHRFSDKIINDDYDESAYDTPTARGSRPAYISGKYDNPKKLKHRQSVAKRVLYHKRKEHEKKRDKLRYEGIRSHAELNNLEGVKVRPTPKKFHTDQDLERYVKRRELRRLLPFKAAVNAKQWKILSNNDKQPDDETIEVLQKYKAQKEIDPHAKPEIQQ